MGITGTEVAKDSSDIVLTDDNFTTIEKAIEHGRGIFDNLIKFILWTLPTSFAEAFIVMIAILLGLQLPILPVQILWINMVTTIFLGMMFSFEPIEKDIMSRKPRSASIPIITRPILLRMINMTLIITFICFIGFYQSLNISYNLEQSRTFIVNLIVFIGILFMFSCRSWETSIFKTSLTQNKPMLWGTIGMIVLQIIFTYTSLFQLLFKTSALTICHWGYILILSLIVLSIIEIEKLIIRHKNR